SRDPGQLPFMTSQITQQADTMSLSAVNRSTCEDHPQSIGSACEAWQPLRAAIVGQLAALKLSEREAGFCNSDANVRCHRKLKTLINRVTVDDCEGRLGQNRQRLDQLRADLRLEAPAKSCTGSSDREQSDGIVVLGLLEPIHEPKRRIRRKHRALARRRDAHRQAS